MIIMPPPPYSYIVLINKKKGNWVEVKLRINAH
jgi:hypothetical protein